MAKKKVKALKSIAGVKVPKAIRKSPLLDALLNHPVGRVILAEALVAAVAAASAVLARSAPSARQMGEASETVGQAARESLGIASKGASAAADAIGAIVTDVARQLLSRPKRNKKSPSEDRNDTRKRTTRSNRKRASQAH